MINPIRKFRQVKFAYHFGAQLLDRATDDGSSGVDVLVRALKALTSRLPELGTTIQDDLAKWQDNYRKI